jgi:hypothetical protein
MRLVIVDNLSASANGRAVIDQMSDVLPTLPDWTRLVFVETGPEDDDAGDGKRFAGRPQALKKLINLVENDPRGKVLAIDPPRDLAHWLQERASCYQATLDIAAARLLAECIGAIWFWLIQSYKRPTPAGRAITRDDVALLTLFCRGNIFQMVDALGRRNGKQALIAAQAWMMGIATVSSPRSRGSTGCSSRCVSSSTVGNR